MRYKRFTYFFIYLMVAINLSIGIFNYIIDPYGKNNTFITTYNQEKAIRDERISKFKMLQENPDAKSFFFGSSKVLMLDPLLFENITGSSTLNMAFSSASADEYYLYIKYLLKTRKAEHIVIGIDFFAYTKGYDSTGTLPQELRDYFKLDKNYPLSNYISFSMLKKSIKTLKANMKNTLNKHSKYTPKGKVNMKSHVKVKNNIIDEPPRWGTKYDEISHESLNHLKEIATMCQEKGVNLHLFSTPMYITQITMKDSKFKQYKQLIQYIVNNIAPIWDFNNLEAINTNPYGYADIFHFYYPIADVILNTMLQKETNSTYYGKLLSRNNINTYFDIIDERLKRIVTTKP